MRKCAHVACGYQIKDWRNHVMAAKVPGATAVLLIPKNQVFQAFPRPYVVLPIRGHRQHLKAMVRIRATYVSAAT